MKFYSGFSLRDEAHFFAPWRYTSDYSVAGFSYGAIEAALHVSQSDRRIDTLQLFSPAFFQTQSEAFKRAQILGFRRNQEGYLEAFMTRCFEPYARRETLHVRPQEEDLRRLLYYVWTNVLLERIVARGVQIEVYLGGQDAIIDAEAAREFFTPFATVYFIKNGNHFLVQE
ncbi:MAG: pimelyl-ACP methyl ester esterase BioV [Campylobacterales bacterium]|nr:pimelyl-ACP methyl ester esterase BioV [Campylobacterales bacterium]